MQSDRAPEPKTQKTQNPPNNNKPNPIHKLARRPQLLIIASPVPIPSPIPHVANIVSIIVVQYSSQEVEYGLNSAGFGGAADQPQARDCRVDQEYEEIGWHVLAGVSGAVLGS